MLICRVSGDLFFETYKKSSIKRLKNYVFKCFFEFNRDTLKSNHVKLCIVDDWYGKKVPTVHWVYRNPF